MIRMLHREETKRPTLAELRRLLKAKKNGRGSISRSEKEKSYSTEMYWINDFCIISLVKIMGYELEKLFNHHGSMVKS